jgi:hypothetical protein
MRVLRQKVESLVRRSGQRGSAPSAPELGCRTRSKHASPRAPRLPMSTVSRLRRRSSAYVSLTRLSARAEGGVSGGCARPPLIGIDSGLSSGAARVSQRPLQEQRPCSWSLVCGSPDGIEFLNGARERDRTSRRTPGSNVEDELSRRLRAQPRQLQPRDHPPRRRHPRWLSHHFRGT